MQSAVEKRRFPRIEFHAPLRYQIRGIPEFNNTVGEDISCQGVAFTSAKFIAPGTSLMLEISLLSRCLKPIGKIAWSHPLPHCDRYKAGVEFLELNRDEKNFLTDYVEMQRSNF